MTQKTITYLSIIIIALGFIFLANGLILAWSPPGSAPPAGNVSAPLNTGSAGQSKAGGLILNTGGATNGLVVDQGRTLLGTASHSYQPSGANWDYNVTLNGADYTSIGFHDSGHSVGSIRYYAGNFYIGYDDGWGTAKVNVAQDLSVGGTAGFGGADYVKIASASAGNCNASLSSIMLAGSRLSDRCDGNLYLTPGAGSSYSVVAEGYLGVNQSLSVNGSIGVGGKLQIENDSIHRTDNGALWIGNKNTSGVGMGDPSSQIYVELFGWLRTAGNGVAYGSYGKTKYYTIMANGGNRTGGGIAVSDDGGFFDWNDGYITYEPLCCNQGLKVNSNIYVNGFYSGTFCDIAESYEPSSDSQELEPGDIVVLDEQEEMKVKKSTEPYSSLVAGIVSTNPNMVMGVQEGNEEQAPIALLGHVPTKVTAENGPIKIGDLIVTSSRPGYGMKCDDYEKCQEAIIGKALQNLESGEGLIEVLMRGGF